MKPTSRDAFGGGMTISSTARSATPRRTLPSTGRILSACVAVSLAAAQAVAQLPVTDLSDRAVETLIPPEFEGEFFNRIGAIAVRDDGLWVLDAGHGRVFRFDAASRVVAAFGGQGNGPGEFILPSALRVDSAVTIPDLRQVRVSRFTLDGEHLVTRADRERAEADFRRERNVRGQVTFEAWPSHWSLATSLLVSDDGKVWARRAVHEDERQHWTEVDLHGPLRRHVILPEGFSLRAIADGRLYGVATDELDVQRVAFLDRR